MNSIKKVVDIIHHPELGVTQLEFEYNNLKEDSERIAFLEAFKVILQSGTDREKSACLTVIDMINKTHEFKGLIKDLVVNVSLHQCQSLINSLLWASTRLAEDWGITFIHQVISTFKPKNNEYSYLFSMGVRCLISTVHWKTGLSEVIWIVNHYTDEFIVDLFAYFKWKRPDEDLAFLLNTIGIIDEKSTSKKIEKLQSQVKKRFRDHYQKL